MNSRERGIRGELDWRDFLRGQGYEEARRGQQYRGGGDSPDVVGVPRLHSEVKYTQCLRLYDAVDQARRDATDGNLPIVAHRCNDDRRKSTCRGEWLVILSAEDFFKLWKEAGR